MGLMDKVKKILFDEDIIEVPVGSDDLPERTPKKMVNSSGFIDHGNDEEEFDENPIKEIKIPKDEDLEEEKEEIRKFNLQEEFKDDLNDDYIQSYNDSNEEDIDIDLDFKDEVIPSRSRNYDDLELSFMDDKEEVKTQEVVTGFRVNEPVERKKELKDYRKMLSAESEESTEKKPFKNTPVISPVWGILDKNYTPDEIVDKTNELNQINSGVVPRSYGPVSYNDQPLPHANYKPSKSELKKDLVELNETISDMVEEEIEVPETKVKTIETKIEETVKEVEDEKVIETTIVHEEYKTIEEPVVEEAVEEMYTTDLDDEVIQTVDYDSYDDIEMPTHSIDDIDTGIDSYEDDHNSIEDAFESTSEFNSINERDNEIEETPEVDFETIVPKKIDLDDDEGLDNTIETDLFNLIDSMYRNEEEDE